MKRKQTKAGYSTPSEYVRELIQGDQEHRATDRLDTLLLEGLDSGELEDYLEARDPAIRAQIEKSNADIASGRTRPADLLAELRATRVAKPRRSAKR